MSKKSISRLRRARKTRSKIRLMEIHRLTVFRSSMHIYAQVMLNDGSEVVASASSSESGVKGKNNGNIDSASKVGKLIAERALEKGIKQVAFDRSGYKFHGRVKALAMAARAAGLSF
jgi:large subunit ribosomal protein L18